MKKLLTFLLCVVLLMGAVGLTACGSFIDSAQKTVSNIDTDNPVAQLSVQSVSAPKLGNIIRTFSSGDNDGEPCVQKRLTATVEPATALNKQVDYSVSWASGAEHIAEDVSEYVTVEPDSDGSAEATVSCYKGFGDDTILITVITREGGFRAYCEVVFSGLISELAIVPQNGLTLTTTNEKVNIKDNYNSITGHDYPIHGQTYYDLGVNRIYDFDVNVNNIFNETSYDLSVDVSASDTPIYICEQRFPQETLNGYDGLSRMLLSDLDLDLFDITLNDTSLRIVVKDKTLSNYADPVYYYRSNYLSNPTPYYFPMKEDGWTNTEVPISQNETNFNSAYFTVTISDAKSGLSDSFKFWISSTAAGLTLSSYTMEF